MILFLGLAIFPVLGASASVGAVPSFIDFGEVGAGETVEMDVYVRTSYDQDFEINPSARAGRGSIMFREGRDQRFETSEADITDWVELEQGVYVNTSERYEADITGGGTANVNSEFTMRVNVPREDVDPGYHYGSIRLNPEIFEDQGGAGTTNWGETRIDFRLRVPGNAERQIVADDVRAFRLDEDAAVVELLLRNSGTVTAGTDDLSFEVYDSRREEVVELSASNTRLESGETEWVEASWDENERIDADNYRLEGDVNYITGSATVSESFSLPDYDVIEVRPADEDEEGVTSQDTVPLWLVMMVLLILAVLMWSFNVNPMWIILIIGVLGISAFILMSEVSNYLVILFLMMVSIILYRGF